MIQAFIALYAKENHLTDAEVIEQFGWILKQVKLIDDLYCPAEVHESFEGLQLQESTVALAQDFESGDLVGYTEVAYNPETGREIAIDDGEWT